MLLKSLMEKEIAMELAIFFGGGGDVTASGHQIT
jgi:hypothetical protein